MKISTLYSPAPWRIDRWRDGIDIRSDNGDIVHDWPQSTANAQANACMIVAAPDMFQALRDLILDLERMGITPHHRSSLGDSMKDARAAIHRATNPAAEIPRR